MRYDVFGIGSALMDILVEVDDKTIDELGLTKGQFNLIDEGQSKDLIEKLKGLKITTAPGGSSANTLYGVALLGGTAIFCGMVGTDEHGLVYEQMMCDGGVVPKLGKCKLATGNAITLISPDMERTFAVHLGAAMKLLRENVLFEDIMSSSIVHVEGYQLEDPALRDVSLHALQFARKNRIKISIDLGDPGIVSRCRDDIREIVNRYADITFANEEEARALTGKDPEEALEIIAGISSIAIVKTGAKGSMIYSEGKRIDIPAYKTLALDTTGAGDMYAAGVLYGISRKLPLKVCGNIGSRYASKVVETVGARLRKIDKDEIERFIASIE